MEMKYVVVFGLMIATFLALAVGLGVMIAGGKVNAKYGNKLMVLRVSLQGLTLLLLGILFFTKR